MFGFRPLGNHYYKEIDTQFFTESILIGNKCLIELDSQGTYSGKNSLKLFSQNSMSSLSGYLPGTKFSPISK